MAGSEPALFEWLPGWAREEVLGLALAHWVGILTAIILGVILHKILSIVITRRFAAWTDHQQSIDSDFEHKVARPFALGLTGLFWLMCLMLLSLPDPAQTMLEIASKLISIVGIVWGCYRLVDLVQLIFNWRKGGELDGTDAMIIPLLEKSLRLFILVFGLVLAADLFSVEVTTLLTGLGIGGLAIALAARDTLSNLFGSLTILLDKPFGIGDWILVDDIEGTVEEIGFRTTRVRTFRDTLVSVPNSTLVNKAVENYGRREWRRYSTHLELALATTPLQVSNFVHGIQELIAAHPFTRKDYYIVRLHHHGPQSLRVLLYVFWKVPDWGAELEERERLLLDLRLLSDELKIEWYNPLERVLKTYPDSITMSDLGSTKNAEIVKSAASQSALPMPDTKLVTQIVETIMARHETDMNMGGSTEEA